MLKDITLGQYFPGNSVIHRLDPRTKLVMLVVYIVALFLASGPASYGLMLVLLLTSIRISSIPGKAFLRGMEFCRSKGRSVRYSVYTKRAFHATTWDIAMIT